MEAWRNLKGVKTRFTSRCGPVVLMDETAEAIAALYVTDG
jgi:hypothetical protein